MWIFMGCIVTQLSALAVLFITIRVDIITNEKTLQVTTNKMGTNSTVIDVPKHKVTTTTPEPYEDVPIHRKNTAEDDKSVTGDIDEVTDTLMEIKITGQDILEKLEGAIKSLRESYTLYKFFVKPLQKKQKSLMLTITMFAMVYCCLESLVFIYGLGMRDEILIDMYMKTAYWTIGFISLNVAIQLYFFPSPYQAGTVALMILHGVFLGFARILITNIKGRNELNYKRKNGKLTEEKSFVTDEIKI